MSASSPSGFGQFIPGFDFLQKLGQGGGVGASGLGHWIAPTVSVEELEQRITELKAVQFWLEQNLLALKTTMQALEVQKMTLVALRGMNLSVSEVAKAFAAPADARAGAGGAGSSKTASSWPYAAPAPAAPAGKATDQGAGGEPPGRKASAARKGARHSRPPPDPKSASAAAPGMADPMQWWGALADQFRQIAAQSMRQSGDAPPEVAGVQAAAAAAQNKARRSDGRVPDKGKPAVKAGKTVRRRPAA